jgi:AcrR family transcriptional regulator
LRLNWIYGMMIIMRNTTNQRSAAKQVSHERIVDVAARAIRRSGYDGTGVAEIMKEAGLTHGAFYAHFASREAMLAEAADRAGAQSNAATAAAVASVAPQQAMETLIRGYLSKEHEEATETGCPIAALVSEMPRQSPEVRRAATRRIKGATLVGSLALARAVDEPTLAAKLREATIQHLLSLAR